MAEDATNLTTSVTIHGNHTIPRNTKYKPQNATKSSFYNNELKKITTMERSPKNIYLIMFR
jgi:hypothetical protein